MIDWKEEMKTFVITVRVRYIQYQTVFIDYLYTVPIVPLPVCYSTRRGTDEMPHEARGRGRSELVRRWSVLLIFSSRVSFISWDLVARHKGRTWKDLGPSKSFVTGTFDR